MPAVEERLTVTWLGHSTVLVESGGVRVLTDPLLRPHVWHLRRVAETVAVPSHVDAVLVSHAHYDHLDVASLRRVDADTVVVPRGTGRRLRRVCGRIVELAEDEELEVGGLSVRAIHAEHEGRRHPFAPSTPALGFVISGPQSVYFAGDTDIFPGMRDLAGELEVALLPVAGWGEKLGPGHLDPSRAAEALRLLRPRVAIPIHWGTYRPRGLPSDSATLRSPALAFERIAADLAPEVEICILAPGEAAVLPKRTTAVKA